jgi:hypothetical protein
MIRTIVKLIIFAVVVNAAFNVVPPFWKNFRFKDAVGELARFSGKLDDKKIAADVMDIAREMDIPLVAESVQVSRLERRVVVEARYHVELQYFPGQFYPWDFAFRVVGQPGRYDGVIP